MVPEWKPEWNREAIMVFFRLPSLMTADKPCSQLQPSLICTLISNLSVGPESFRVWNSPSSAKTWSYSAREAMKITAWIESKHRSHFFLSERCPPTSIMVMNKSWRNEKKNENFMLGSLHILVTSFVFCHFSCAIFCMMFFVCKVRRARRYEKWTNYYVILCNFIAKNNQKPSYQIGMKKTLVLVWRFLNSFVNGNFQIGLVVEEVNNLLLKLRICPRFFCFLKF